VTIHEHGLRSKSGRAGRKSKFSSPSREKRFRRETTGSLFGGGLHDAVNFAATGHPTSRIGIDGISRLIRRQNLCNCVATTQLHHHTLQFLINSHWQAAFIPKPSPLEFLANERLNLIQLMRGNGIKTPPRIATDSLAEYYVDTIC
jgi:hypothetical protein